MHGRPAAVVHPRQVSGGQSLGTAYTPGLTIARDLLVRKERRLPLAGEILVSVGDEVEAATPVARALLPGDLVTIRASDEIGLEPEDLEWALKVGEGDAVEADDVLAEAKGIFGLFTSRVRTPVAGTVEFASTATGHVGIRREPVPVEVTAFVRGRVAEVRAPDTVTVETRAAVVQGVFGVGGETCGVITCPVSGPDSTLTAADVPAEARGRIVVAGANADGEAMRLLAERGAAGLVTGSITDAALREFLGFDLGLAITGHEDVPFPVIVTDGFGSVPMSGAAFELLRSREGREASMTGRTQIRAGAVRPEVVSPLEKPLPPRRQERPAPCERQQKHLLTSPRPDTATATPTDASVAVPGCSAVLGALAVESVSTSGSELTPGRRVRLIRYPRFGLVGTVVGLPEEPREVASGARARVVVVKLADGAEVAVPRSNVELY